jgi:DNA-directed RNA polymerase beta' subunit
MSQGPSLTYSSRIAGIRFSIAGTEDVVRESCVGVTSYDLFRDNKPVDGGLYNAHLGTTDYEYKCKTCFHNKSRCLGHDGHFVLNYPVFSPMCLPEARKWLKIVCFECGKPVIPNRMFERFAPAKRVDEAQKIARSVARKCAHCHAPHPTVKKDPNDQLVMTAEYYVDKRKVREEILYPHRVAEIFNRIEPETVLALGRPLESSPRKFVLNAVKIPAVTIRPDSDAGASGRIDDTKDITTMLQALMKKNAGMPAVTPAQIDLKLRKMIFELSAAYYDMIRASGNAGNFSDRLKGKQGRNRKTQLGKRVHYMFRSTIVGDVTLRIDEVGVSVKFAKNIQMEEVVQEYNKAELMRLVQNGRHRYPGCTEVRKRSSGALISVDNPLDIELEPGDILYRDMVTGDWFNFNRQPSIKPSNISAMRARVVEDPDVLVLSMNVIACPAFDADFDGDQMNGIVNSGLGPRNELRMLSAFENWFIFHSSSTPGVGQIDDSVIGLFELTLNGVRVDKYHAMLVFANTTYSPSFADMDPHDTITGRDCITRVMAQTPVNFTRKPQYYDEKLAPYMHYDASDIHVKIVRGEHVSGVLDKKSIGKGAAGGLYHIVCNDYGAKSALRLIFDMQQMAVAYTLQRGYTIGIHDLLVSADAKAEIDRVASDIINKSALVTDRLNRGEIIPPIGMTVEEFYEQQQIATLRAGDDFIEPVLGSLNTRTNNLLKIVFSGSKGSLDNVFNMVSSVGQKIINGERIKQKFGHKRTLAYYRRFETTPESRGYIANSYVGGVTSPEYVFNAMYARFDFISKALLTSIAGDQNRKSIKNLESITVNNFRSACKHKNVLQFLYGEDGLDPRNVEMVDFVTVGMDDATLAERYKVVNMPAAPAGAANAAAEATASATRGNTAAATVTTNTAANKATKITLSAAASPLPPELAAIAVAQYDRVRANRDRYRDIFIRVESVNPGSRMQTSRLLPVNVARMLVDVAREYSDIVRPVDVTSADGVAEATRVTALVDQLTESLPWLHMNDGARALFPGGQPPAHIAQACWLVQMSLREHLALATVLALGERAIRIVCDRVRLVYLRALIDPGSAVGIIAALAFSGPLTQYVLDAHHRSAAGGTSKSGMTRVKEVMAARDVAKLEFPQMQLRLLPEIETNQARVQEVANNIEMMQLRQFVTVFQIFYEKFGKPMHPTYAHEREMIANFARLNPLMTPPGDLFRWCVRIVINKTTLILKNMTVDLIVSRLREIYPDIYIVYTGENTPEVVMRVYVRAGLRDARGVGVFKANVETDHMVGVAHMLIDTIIRGVNGVTNTNVVKQARTRVGADGGLESQDVYLIETVGTNLSDVLANQNVDPRYVSTDAILETYRMYGIEAARSKIVNELRKLSECNHRHYLVYADEMTSTGRVTSIERSGLSTREASNYLLRMGFGAPIPTLEEAGVCAAKDEVTGVTAPLLVGSVPRVGTLYNSVQVDGDIVRSNVKKPDDILDTL